MFAPLPRMSRSSSRATRPCACGCERPTQRTWFPGHDGRATGWAIRVERGMALDDVPANERKGAVRMLRSRGTFDAVIERGNPRKQAA